MAAGMATAAADEVLCRAGWRMRVRQVLPPPRPVAEQSVAAQGGGWVAEIGRDGGERRISSLLLELSGEWRKLPRLCHKHGPPAQHTNLVMGGAAPLSPQQTHTSLDYVSPPPSLLLLFQPAEMICLIWQGQSGRPCLPAAAERRRRQLTLLLFGVVEKKLEH